MAESTGSEPEEDVEVQPAQGDAGAPAESPRHDMVDLPTGKGLRPGEANELCRVRRVTVILLAGTAKSGKTTLLSSLQLLFQKGPFAGHLFAGSRTLVGFEERNYYVETVSRGDKPTMERTKFTELLHLRVRDERVVHPSRDLLLCDLSGEDFREAKDSIEACQSLEIIRRADSFVLLIDGEKLANHASRHRAKNDAMTLLRSCLDAGMLGAHSFVDVLFTKWDLVQETEDRPAFEAFATQVETDIKSQLGSRVRELQVYRVAAHPHTTDLPLGYGLEDVFATWVKRGPAVRQTALKLPDQAAVSTEYDRFLWRGLKDVLPEEVV